MAPAIVQLNGNHEPSATNVHAQESRPISIKINDLHIQGFKPTENVASFLGITFAEIPARFRNARLVDPSSTRGMVDATSYGPRCPQPVDVSREQRPHFYQGIMTSFETPMSEFQCLKLNIYAPAIALKSVNSKLPVLVWLHGGGWTVGDGNSEYTGEFLVEESVRLMQPMIYVGINYRLGYFGFLDSRELREEAVRLGEPYQANQGLYDQRLGLQWVQKYIHHFGGDGSNVTIAGESAGGWSVLAHLRSNVPVCQRAIAMSAPVWSFGGAVEKSQRTFDRLVAATRVSASAPTMDKLAALRDLTAAQMEDLLRGEFVHPGWDPQWFVHQSPESHLEEFDKLPHWIKGLAVGWTKDEYALWGLQHRGCSVDAIQETLRSCFSDESFGREVMREYLVEKATSAKEALEGLLEFGTESFFGMVPLSLARLNSPLVSIYRFDQIDDHEESPIRGRAYHSIDNVFFNRLPAVTGPSAPVEYKQTLDAHSQAWVNFCNGRQPWKPYVEEEQIMIFNALRSGLKRWNPERLRRLASTEKRKEMLKAGGMKLLFAKTNMGAELKEIFRPGQE